MNQRDQDLTTLTDRRIALNQATFRDANERIEAAADKLALVGPVPFICECADTACTQIVRLTFDEYEQVRQQPRWFLTAPEHEWIALNAGVGEVRERHDGYVVVEKIGVAGEVAEETYGSPGRRG
jgi:hypothetical protein